MRSHPSEFAKTLLLPIERRAKREETAFPLLYQQSSILRVLEAAVNECHRLESQFRLVFLGSAKGTFASGEVFSRIPVRLIVRFPLFVRAVIRIRVDTLVSFRIGGNFRNTLNLFFGFSEICFRARVGDGFGAAF